MSDSVRPHRQQPTRLPRPWDSRTLSGLPFPSPVRESEVAQSCPTHSDPMDCSLSGSSGHGIFQARVLEWGAIAFSQLLVVKSTSSSTGDIRDVGSISGWGRPSEEGDGQPIPVFLPGESHGQRSLEGYGPRDPKESYSTEGT